MSICRMSLILLGCISAHHGNHWWEVGAGAALLETPKLLYMGPSFSSSMYQMQILSGSKALLEVLLTLNRQLC